MLKTVRVTNKVTPGSSQRLRVVAPYGSSLAIPYSNGVHILDRNNWNVEHMLVNAHSKG